MESAAEKDFSQPQKSVVVRLLRRGKSVNQKPYRQQDSAYSWLVCISGLLANALILGVSYGYGVLFPVLLKEFKQGKAKTAWVGSIAYAASGLFGPLAGKIYDRYGPRLVTFCGSLTCVVALLLTSQAPNLELIYLTFGLLYGLGSCFVFVTNFMIVPRYFVKRRAFAVGMISTGPGMGLLVMSPIMQSLLDVIGWRKSLMVIAAMLCLPCALASYTFDPNVADGLSLENVKENKVEENRGSKFRGLLDLSVFRNSHFLIYTAATFVACIGHVVPIVHMIRYSEDLGISADAASWLFFYNGLSSGVGRALVGRVGDIKRFFIPTLFLIGLIMAGISTLMLPLATSYTSLVVYMVALGVADACIVTNVNLLILASITDRNRTQGFGMFQFVIAIALALGPPLGGFIADIEGSYAPAFYMAGAMELTAAGIASLAFCFPSNKDKVNDEVKTPELELLTVTERETVL